VHRDGFAPTRRMAKTNVSEGFCAVVLSAACCAGDESSVSPVSPDLASQGANESSVHRGRARKQGGAIRLSDVWPVRTADYRLRLSDDLPEAAAEWPVRRSLVRQPVRGASGRALRLGIGLRTCHSLGAWAGLGLVAATGRPSRGRPQFVGQL